MAGDVTRLPVALDAMGGDRAPDVVVAGALLACSRGLGPITLVGDAARIEACLQRLGPGGAAVDVVHAAEAIGMAEHPGRAARAKRQSSMHVGFGRVRQGEACAFVSAGNSGAMMAVGLMELRRLPGCDRPAIASAMPSAAGPVVLLDMGANVDCRASHLVQFALMGAAYAAATLGKERPTVGLLSNGTEPSKGTETLREAHRLLTQTDLKYVGFVEGRGVPMGEVDVVVTDGFVGNVVLKLSEGIALALIDRVRGQLADDWLGMVGAPLFKRQLRRLRDELDWENVGGAPLLGLDGIGLVAHGAATPRAIASAIRRAREYHAVGLVDALRVALEQSAFDDMTSTSELPLTRASGPHRPGDE
ncbi:MAG: phosphate acyltransferase PlsX [Myxococcales bacterium]|nr:phosphate acyltransferase PlsX [Myxococcales bacterium]